ncbi:MAG: adenylate/guanylate cyclase domain-containing protein [Chitinophagia bacterium]|nr:adenylate/guanylate cyclase domain-containing protein [Chitinophagia bacterium]
MLLVFSVFLVKERRKSDKLLLNILPEEVAAELKANGAAKARNFNNVTVLFTDFVGFTSVSEFLSPQELVDELHTCFKAFDEIMMRHGIEKIKTVGDAYLAVAGLPVHDEAHATKMVKAALEIRDFMVQRYAQLGDRSFRVRIGINSGNVVAGIVGVKKFAYDIWGDTVNIAARMEQNGEPDKINVSETTWQLVKNDFQCTYRGEIAAKNKGSLRMYFVD